MAERKKHKPEPDAARPANESVGATLHAARLAKGLEIDAVSQIIHIRPTQIKAIEENNIEALPGMTYAVGFVRSYANFLGLNGAEIVHRFKAEHGHNPAQSKLSFPEPIAESRVPDPMMVGVGAFLALVILVLWTVYANVHGGSKTAADKIPPAPIVTSVADSLQTAATTPALAPATTTTAETSATAAAPPAMAGATTTPPVPETPAAPVAGAEQQQPAVAVPTVAVGAATTPAAEQPKPAEAAPAPAKAADASDDSDSEDDNADEAPAPKAEKADKDDGVIKIKRGKSRITLKATEASWVQVTDSKNNILYRKVLRPGEQYSVPDLPGLSLDTANAGGLDIIVDGRPVQQIGKDGEIVRGVSLNPSELKIKRMQVRD